MALVWDVFSLLHGRIHTNITPGLHSQANKKYTEVGKSTTILKAERGLPFGARCDELNGMGMSKSARHLQ